MITPEQLIPFLSTTDDRVRWAIVDALQNAANPAPITADHIWAALAVVGMARQTSKLVRLLRVVPSSATSTARLLAALNTTRDGHFLDALQICLQRVPFEELQANQQQILAHPKCDRQTKEVTTLRLELATLSMEESFQRLVKCGEEPADGKSGNMNEAVRFAHVEAVARHAGAAQHALQVVQNKQYRDSMTEDLHIEVLGLTRHRPALPLLFEMFCNEEEYGELVQETLLDNLPLIGGEELIPLMEQRFESLESWQQMYAADMLSRIKSPASEEALLRLMDGAKDDSRDLVLHGLISLPSDRVLPKLREVVLSGDYDTSMFDFHHDLLGLADIAGSDFPEKAEVLRQFQAREQEYEKRAAGWEKWFTKKESTKAPLLRKEVASEPVAPGSPIAPIRRGAPKVGRNDPCPCGSGKKYKKCCVKE